MMKKLGAALALALCCTAAIAQSVTVTGAGDISESTNLAQPVPGAEGATQGRKRTSPQPFGHNLFTGGFATERESGLNPDYVVAEGDEILLRIWGATEVNDKMIVDTQGNIFVPKVGPVLVGGVRNSQLNNRVSQAVRGVFTNNVQVYTTLNSAQPVAVFVTGFVNNPGRYAGVAANSLLYFVDRAGGIDADRGSYRDVRLMRNGEEIARADLYDFLLEGRLNVPQLKDGDTIVIGPRRSIVTVSGDARNAYIFEFNAPTLQGEELLGWIRPLAQASHAQWRGFRNGLPVAEYVSLERLSRLGLEDGDQLDIISDHRSNTIVVSVEGIFQGPSQFVLPRDFVLADLLDLIPVDRNLANFDAVSVRRVSIAERQRQTLNDSLRRLESAYLVASSATNEEAQIRTAESRLIADFVQRARHVEPNGRLVLSSGASLHELTLEDGDVITIPQRTQTVLVSGEVLVPQALIHQPGQRAGTYIAKAGGFSDLANPERVIVVRQNGEVITNGDVVVDAGDQVMVLPKVPAKHLQVGKEIVDVIYKVAVSAGVLVAL